MFRVRQRREPRRNNLADLFVPRRKDDMERSEESRSWLTSVLSDIQFWVPVVVLIGGLLLLTVIR
jgi:hypothetical protein